MQHALTRGEDDFQRPSRLLTDAVVEVDELLLLTCEVHGRDKRVLADQLGRATAPGEFAAGWASKA